MFKLVSKFKPTGDQPNAIAKLVKNLKAGAKHHVLLGATGSGKSVTADTLVLIKKDKDVSLKPISEIADMLFNQCASHIKRKNDTEILSSENIGNAKYFAYSINPQTKQTNWKPIRQFIRHASPKNLYRVRTACGREINVTGDHNFWVLRAAKFMLLSTREVQPTDYIPLPLTIQENRSKQNVSSLNILEILKGESLFIDAKPFITKVLQTKKPYEIADALKHHFVFPWQKLYQIKSGAYRGLPLLTVKKVAQILGIEFQPEDAERIVVGSQIHRYTLPAKLPLSNELLRLFGYYIAEGFHTTSRFFSIACSPAKMEPIKEVLEKLGLRYAEKSSNNTINVSSKIYGILLETLCKNGACKKRLPPFWPNLSNKQLAVMLRAYFTGDGDVFTNKNGVIAVSGSKQLASELSYALFRFSIWSRIRKGKQRATNSLSFQKKTYYYIVISGADNLKKFMQFIGFESKEKQQKLEQLALSKRATNVDVTPNIGITIKQIRKEFRITQRILAETSKVPQNTLNMIELGINNPRRVTFEKIIKGFEGLLSNIPQVSQLKNFLNCRWTKIKSVNLQPAQSDYVYDFGVQENETFLAGYGGMFIHNTFTMAKTIEQMQKPALIVSCNKTLAAQLYQEFKEFFPNNAVHYFVSYYDYYQPEAYIPQTDTYIEKDAKINEEIDRLRHAATQDLLTRKDVIVVASVSCIYNIGSPQIYQKVSLEIKNGQKLKRKDFLAYLTSLQYQRNDIDFKPGAFRARGEIIEVYLVTGKEILRVEFLGDKIDKISISKAGVIPKFHILNSKFLLFPAHFWVTPQDKLGIAVENIKLELQERLSELKKEKKLLEAQRLKQRTNYDLEMIEETSYCHGIENYSRHMEFRKPDQAPFTLLDYFSGDFLVFIDESHLTCSQLRAMAVQDRARKNVLIEHGFRLASAIDNRPLTFEEFNQKINQTIYVSATPNHYEKIKAGKKGVIEQLIRPTGLLEPSIEIRSTKNQIRNLIEEIKKTTERKQRVLVLTLTKRLAEAVSDYLAEENIKTQWLHSEVKTLERPGILKDLREGKYDVLVGINLLREGLDIPEVALVAILDADKEGFLRSKTTLIQTMGRAARHKEGRVILYADKITFSMKKAMEEILRRKKIQERYNKKHKITPMPIVKEIRDWPFLSKEKEVASEFWAIRDKKLLEKEMKTAASHLDFERAAEIRDLIKKIK